MYSRDSDIDKEIDYGSASRGIFDKMLRDVDKGILEVSLEYLRFKNGRPDISNARHHHEDAVHLAGSLPFKIMKVCQFPGFKGRMMTEVNKFFDDVHKENDFWNSE